MRFVALSCCLALNWFGLLSSLLCTTVAVADDALVELSKHLGKTPGLVVVVCGGDETDLPVIARLVEQTPWTIFCRGGASPEMEKLRDWARDKGLLGGRVCVVDDPEPSLDLAGDMADAVWVMPRAKAPPEQEILRVLHPGGIGLVEGKRLMKPAPPGVDEWRHPYHAPDNNVVSQDRLAHLPGELRFQTRPVFAAMPNQTLFAGGRIFFFTGHIAFHEREEPLLTTLTVLNAYNGLRLWSRPLTPDYVVHNVAKVATKSEVVFAEGGTLWMLDAATGQQRGALAVPREAAAAGDTDWKWIAQEGDKLWAAFGPPDARVAAHREKREMGQWPWKVANDQTRGMRDRFGAARRLAAYQYPEMKLLWSIAEDAPFDARALCMQGGRIFQLAPGKYLAARDSATGETLWRRTAETSPAVLEANGSDLKRQGWAIGWATYVCARAGGDVVCIAGPPFKRAIGVSLTNGDLLWTADLDTPHAFFCQDALYLVPRVASPVATCRKLDPTTGKVLEQFALGVTGSCTRLTATPNQFFYRPGAGEGRTVYVDLQTEKLSDYEGVVRPNCFDGVVAANGRLYWMPLACDCWQVHGTCSMAPRVALKEPLAAAESPHWAAPTSTAPAARADWPMFRADSAGTATVPVAVAKKVRPLWQQRLGGGGLTAPICARGRVFVGKADGTIQALDAVSGKSLWRASSQAAVVHPPAYWNGRVVFGSCDGFLYCLDAADGRRLGRTELAPQRRLVNIMDRLMSAWPLGGGVVLSDDGTAYTAAGSTAADGAVVAAVDIATGKYRWRHSYTLDRPEPRLSFGVQGSVLLKGETFYVNGGAPVGIVALDARSGENPRVVARLAAGREMFLEPDGTPCCIGPELFCDERARTTLFNRDQSRVYFQTSGRHVALIGGRLFCAHEPKALDRIVDFMNQGPKTSRNVRDVMRAPVDSSILWAGTSSDVCGLAVGANGVVVLHHDCVEAVSADGERLWIASLPAPPVRWGVALTGKQCVVTLSDGLVACFTEDVK